MLHLMKYEFRRQLFSKGLIFGIFLVLLAAFFGFYLTGEENGAVAMLALMSLETLIVLFFAPVEFTFTFDKDMNSKQGYLLFMVPQKSTTILISKLFVSLLQSVVIYTVFFTVVPFCEKLAAGRFERAPHFIEVLCDTFSLGSSDGVNTVKFWAVIFILWLFFTLLSLFASAIPVQGKVASVFRFAGYIAAIFAVFFVLDKAESLFDWLKAPKLVGDIFEWVYLIGISVALFFGTAKLLDKKVSL